MYIPVDDTPACYHSLLTTSSNISRFEDWAPHQDPVWHTVSCCHFSDDRHIMLWHCPFVCTSVRLSVCLFARPSVHPSICLSPSIHPSICLSVCLSVCHGQSWTQTGTMDSICDRHIMSEFCAATVALVGPWIFHVEKGSILCMWHLPKSDEKIPKFFATWELSTPDSVLFVFPWFHVILLKFCYITICVFCNANILPCSAMFGILNSKKHQILSNSAVLSTPSSRLYDFHDLW